MGDTDDTPRSTAGPDRTDDHSRRNAAQSEMLRALFERRQARQAAAPSGEAPPRIAGDTGK